VSKLGAFFGFLCGIGGALLLLLHNPIIPPGEDVPTGSRLYRWSVLEYFGVSYTAADALGLSDSGGSRSLGVPEIELAGASILLLRDSAGQPVGLATRVTVMNDNWNLLGGSVGVDAYTNIFWPNRGSLFLQGYENRWPVMSGEALVELNQATMPPNGYLVSAAHPDEQTMGFAGGSGQLAGISGRYSERLKLDPDNSGLYMGTLWFERAVR